ncbi:MAG: hypothetical protein N6V49_14625 [Serratia symbiotica]|nr:hypothetical protein [Serratia symbiotica]
MLCCENYLKCEVWFTWHLEFHYYYYYYYYYYFFFFFFLGS